MPTKDCLRSKRVEVDSMCPVCNMAEQSNFHVLVTCPVAAQCWHKIGYRYDVRDSTNMEDWVAEVLQHSRKNVINKIFMVAWAIWKNRNDIVWNQKGKECVEIVVSAI